MPTTEIFNKLLVIFPVFPSYGFPSSIAKAIPKTSASQDVTQFKKGNAEDSAIRTTSPKKNILLKKMTLLLLND